MTALRLTTLTLTLALAGLAIATPLCAQEVPRWKPNTESITVSGLSQLKNLRGIITGSHIGQVIAVSASIAVPYNDLHLIQDADASEFDRRIGVAAQLVCHELDIKYPPSQFPLLGPDSCVMDARNDGLKEAHRIVASARQ